MELINASPKIDSASFHCPYCGILAAQFWHKTFVESLPFYQKVPKLFAQDCVLQAKVTGGHGNAVYGSTEENIEALLNRHVRIFQNGVATQLKLEAPNLYLCSCYHCKMVSVWVREIMIYPPSRSGSAPSSDLPAEIKIDFEEARSIVELSPRGAAALLRLAVQKLCKHLGEEGKNIDKDIAAMVAKGLDPLVQQALDIVRVIGNEAVHPGEIDLNDDRETAMTLFELINDIVDQLITRPKRTSEIYARLPASKRNAIDQRNLKAINSNE